MLKSIDPKALFTHPVAAAAASSTLGRRALLGLSALGVVVQGGLYLALNNAFLSKGYESAPSINEAFAGARAYAFDETRLPVPAPPNTRPGRRPPSGSNTIGAT